MSYDGHRQRIKKRFVQEGLDHWDPYLQLELLLTLAHARKDTKPIAKDLLQKFGSLAGVMDAPEKELLSVAQVGPALVSLLKITRDMGRAYITSSAQEKDLVNQPELAVAILRADLVGAQREHIRALFLNTANKLIASELLCVGTLDQAPLYPRTIVERTIALKAAAVILGHNHPGGSLTPSSEDKQITSDIQKALATIDVRLLDHIIVTPNGWMSFQQKQLL